MQRAELHVLKLDAVAAVRRNYHIRALLHGVVEDIVDIGKHAGFEGQDVMLAALGREIINVIVPEARPKLELIGTLTALEEIIAAATDQCVGALEPVKIITTIATDQRISPISPND